MIGTWKPDRTGIPLQRGMIYASSKAIGVKNSFHRIKEGLIKLFDGDRTTGTGLVAQSCTENMKKICAKKSTCRNRAKVC